MGSAAVGSLETLALAWVAAIDEETQGGKGIERRRRGKSETTKENMRDRRGGREGGGGEGGREGGRRSSFSSHRFLLRPPDLPFHEEVIPLKGARNDSQFFLPWA